MPGMRPADMRLSFRYLCYSGACPSCSRSIRLVERYTPFRTAHYTDAHDQAITCCPGCSHPLDTELRPEATPGYTLLA